MLTISSTTLIFQSLISYAGRQPSALLVLLSDVSIKSHANVDCVLIKSPFIERSVSTGERLDFTAGRYGTATFDVGIARSWLHCCDEWHDACEAATILLRDPVPEIGRFRVIDVVEDRLAQLESLVEGSYVALSYVWGTTKSYVTTTADKEELSAPGALEMLCH